jgi:peptidoglycan-N-acetylglucosamine deacetylase
MLGVALGGTGLAIAVGAGYQSMAPTGQWYGKTFTGLPRGAKQLALTYDDGPNTLHTQRLLEVLAKHGVHATFFMIGRFVRELPEIAREVAAAGHVIGNHTFTHPLLIFENAAQTRDQLQTCESALDEVVGAHSNLFRPPYGGRRPSTLRIARGLGLQPILWNITGFDWDAPSAEYIENKVSRHVDGGNVVLLHDGSHRGVGADRSRTVIATDRLLARYKSEGYEFVTIPQMMENAG